MKKTIFAVILILLIPYLFEGKSVSEAMLKHRLELMGGLKFRSQTVFTFQNSKDFYSGLINNMISKYGKKKLMETGDFLRIVGLISKYTNFTEIYKRTLLNHAGAYYDTDSGTIKILSDFRDNIDPLNSLILIHELRRLLQDRYYAVFKNSVKYLMFDDRKLAAEAASIGDAMFMLSLYAKAYTPFPVEPGLSLSGYNSTSLLTFSPLKFSFNMAGMPAKIKKYFSMPYILGLRFVFSVVQKKKKNGLKMILKRPPVSSEQIIHPGKYLKNEAPIPVKVNYIPSNFKLIRSGVIGEYLTGLLLGKMSLTDNIGRGWGGDYFRLFRKGSDHFLIWKSVWDTKKAASGFYVVFLKFLKDKYSLIFRNGNIKGNPFKAAKSGGEFFFIRILGEKIVFAKTSDRVEINRFIEGGIYD